MCAGAGNWVVTYPGIQVAGPQAQAGAALLQECRNIQPGEIGIATIHTLLQLRVFLIMPCTACYAWNVLLRISYSSSLKIEATLTEVKSKFHMLWEAFHLNT